MASLRGGQQIWSSTTVNSGDKSPLVEVGPGPYVAVYISNESAVNMTFDVEVAATASPKAGRNALDGTADGGLTWHKLNGKTAITINAGAKLAIDLAPFSAPFVRLIRTDALAAGAVTALVSAYGVN